MESDLRHVSHLILQLIQYCLGRILDIKWQDHIPNSEILTHAGVTSINVHSPEPAVSRVAWPCAAHGGRPHSKRCPLQSAGIRQSTSGATSPPL